MLCYVCAVVLFAQCISVFLKDVHYTQVEGYMVETEYPRNQADEYLTSGSNMYLVQVSLVLSFILLMA